jgi:uncharacterized membrane protein
MYFNDASGVRGIHRVLHTQRGINRILHNARFYFKIQVSY